MSVTSTYVIRVRGTLPVERWGTWFEETEMRETDEGDTLLISAVADQAALYGLLARLRDLALPLISLQLLDGESDALSQ